MTGKNYTISAIRMVCTISIVLLHIFQQYRSIFPIANIISDWLNLGLVMFFCISAFLYSRRDISQSINWLFRRFRDLIVPSFLVGAIVLVIYFCCGYRRYDRIWDVILSCLGFQVWVKNSWLFMQLWFLSYILFCYLTVPLIQRIQCNNCSNIRFWILLIGASAGLQIITYTIETILNIKLLSAGILLRFYLPYFIFKRYDLCGDSLRRIMRILSATSLVAVCVTCLCRYTNIVYLPESIKELMFIYTQTLTGIVVFYWLYHGVSCIRIPQSLLNISDTYSYAVYLTHCLFIGYSTSIIRACNYSAPGVLLALLLTAVASIGLQKLVQLLLRRS